MCGSCQVCAWCWPHDTLARLLLAAAPGPAIQKVAQESASALALLKYLPVNSGEEADAVTQALQVSLCNYSCTAMCIVSMCCCVHV